MVKPITTERWKRAQLAERKCHTYDYDEGVRLYKFSYECYANYINLTKVNGTVIEIGCADFPALQHYPASHGIVIEPMPSPILDRIVKECNLTLIKEPVENIILPPCDEIWLMNVMQHIIDPDLFVDKCKEAASVIRYFEPVDFPTCEYHPHTFTMDDFVHWFGDAKRYTDKVPHFHQADCAYGVWRKGV